MYVFWFKKCRFRGTSMAVQWLKLGLPMHGVRIRSLVGERRSCSPWGQKNRSRSNIVTRSVKTLKVAHIPLQPPPPPKKRIHDSQFSEHLHVHEFLEFLHQPFGGRRMRKVKDVVLTSSNQSAALSSTSSHVRQFRKEKMELGDSVREDENLCYQLRSKNTDENVVLMKCIDRLTEDLLWKTLGISETVEERATLIVGHSGRHQSLQSPLI